MSNARDSISVISKLFSLKGRMVKGEMFAGSTFRGVLTNIVTRRFEVDDGISSEMDWPESIELDNEEAYTHRIIGLKKIELA